MKHVKLTAIALMALWVSVCSWTPGAFSAQNGPIKQLEEQVAREPNNVQVLQQLGWAYFYQARGGDAQAADKAIATFERAVTLAPEASSLMRALGLTYFLKTAILAQSRAGAPEVTTALQHTLAAFDRALERTPEDPILLSAHGSALTILSGYQQSQELLMKGIEEMNRAVNAHPNGIHARLFRGFTHLNLPPRFRNQSAAIEDLQAILKALPAGYNEQAQGVMHVLMGDVYWEAKELAKAKAEYEAAVTLSSSAAQEARARLATLAQSQFDAQAVGRYRANLTNCALCHAN